MTRLYAAFFVGIPLLWLIARQARSARWRQILFLAASYLFYSTFGLPALAILLASTLFNFVWGSVIRRRPTTAMLWIGIVANVALLSVFKYLPQVAGQLDPSFPWASRVAHLALPIGISFWTFQGLSYLFDQYREERLDPTLIEFMLYMGFAPTVLSGPICRLPELLPQFRETTKATWSNVTEGARSIWVGVLMITLARFLGGGLDGRGVNWGFDHAGLQLNGADVWLLLVGYGFLLFFDFAGYSRVVIGIAQMFGIRLPENFRQPYLSATPSVFWTRWHITLSFWIRDYLFMPLATMRREVWWRNTMLVVSMIVFGLWHKASALFLLWGTYQGLLLLAHRLIQQWQRRRGISMSGSTGTLVSWLVTFVAITLGWIMFRARDGSQAMALLARAVMPFSSQPMALPGTFALFVVGVVAAYMAIAAVGRRYTEEGAIFVALPVELRYACYASIFYFAVFHTADPQSFVYFQF
jgi:alginate O-acetyltransferase complex protein AlgI